MGRLHAQPLRILETAQALLKSGRLRHPPAWFAAVSAYPPSLETLSRPPKRGAKNNHDHEHDMMNFGSGNHISGTSSADNDPVRYSSHVVKSTSKSRKPNRKIFMPEHIQYPEDRLRTEFFGDHPWELARPRVVIEDDLRITNEEKESGIAQGQSQKLSNSDCDWSSGVVQKGRPTDGENVVQRWLYLMGQSSPSTSSSSSSSTSSPPNTKLSKYVAYDIARKEFYAVRYAQSIEQRVSQEEALYVGASFGPGPIQIAEQLENAAYRQLKTWAEEQIMTSQPVVESNFSKVNQESDQANK